MTDPSFRSAWGMQEPRKSMYWNRPDLLREELIGRERLRLDAERRHLTSHDGKDEVEPRL